MRPNVSLKKEDYLRFLGDFSEVRKFYDSCFYVYGSLISGTPAYGRSDIDGGVILNDKVVTHKGRLLDISKLFVECWERSPVRVQFNLLDRQTASDGRFLSYDLSFTDWIKKSGRVLAGDEDLVEGMTGFKFKDETLRGIAYNFRSLRNGYLTVVRDFKYDPRKLAENTENALENLIRLPKKILLIRGGSVVDNKASAITKLQRMFPELDLEFVRRVQRLSRNPHKWYKAIENDKLSSGFPIYTKALTAFERVIESYLNAFPEISDKEVRF